MIKESEDNCNYLKSHKFISEISAHDVRLGAKKLTKWQVNFGSTGVGLLMIRYPEIEPIIRSYIDI